jgi:hypothetical protein
MSTARNTPRRRRTKTYCANGLFIKWRAGITNDRAKETSRMSEISSKEERQTRRFPNSTNSIESSVIRYLPQYGPAIWLAPKTMTSNASPATILPTIVILFWRGAWSDRRIRRIRRRRCADPDTAGRHTTCGGKNPGAPAYAELYRANRRVDGVRVERPA